MKFSEYKITDKNTAHAYGQYFYDALLESYLDKNINLLEMGVQRGPSILAFAQVLSKAKVYGIDRDLAQNKFKEQQDATGRVTLHQMNLYAPNALEVAKEKLGNTKFDIIIDDASHAGRHQIQLFKAFYPRLKINGTYVIEDCYDFQNVAKEIKPFVKEGTIEIVDLRKLHNKLNDDVLIVVKKHSLLTLL